MRSSRQPGEAERGQHEPEQQRVPGGVGHVRRDRGEAARRRLPDLVEDDAGRERADGQAGAEPVEPDARGEAGRPVCGRAARDRRRPAGRARDSRRRRATGTADSRPSRARPSSRCRPTVQASTPSPISSHAARSRPPQPARETCERRGQPDSVVQPVREQLAHRRARRSRSRAGRRRGRRAAQRRPARSSADRGRRTDARQGAGACWLTTSLIYRGFRPKPVQTAGTESLERGIPPLRFTALNRCARRAVDSARGDRLRLLRRRAAGRCPLLQRLRRADAPAVPRLRIRAARLRALLLGLRHRAPQGRSAGRRHRRAAGAAGRHRPLRRPRRLDRARRAARPRGCARPPGRALRRCCTRRSRRFGGTTEKFVGDAILAVFGIPQTHEDDPERAVRAALAAHERVHRLRRPRPRRVRRRGRPADRREHGRGGRGPRGRGARRADGQRRRGQRRRASSAERADPGRCSSGNAPTRRRTARSRTGRAERSV